MGEEMHHAVSVHGVRVGALSQRGDYTRFLFDDEYVENPERPVLGLRFEENLGHPYNSALRLPPWFSNLLPEGPLREWIAEDRGVSPDREMELLAHVGHDLPGAVQISPEDGYASDHGWPDSGVDDARSCSEPSPWRFSLAGVALKFSMLAKADRLTVPSGGELGDWLVKFPDERFQGVPLNEFAMMSLAHESGLDVPELRMVHRDQMDGLPERMWPNREVQAYAVRRFDRAGAKRTPVHFEDFAQVLDRYPNKKYESKFETAAAVAYRGLDVESLREAVRRMVFSVLIGNGDAHLKNWALIYPDRRRPVLAPAYDLVATFVYAPSGDVADLALKLDGSRRFETVKAATFERLEQHLDRRFGTNSQADLAATAVETARRVREAWPVAAELLRDSPVRGVVNDWMVRRLAGFGV